MRNEKPLCSFVFLWTCCLLLLKLQANICFVSGNKSIASLSAISYSSGADAQSLKALRPQTALHDSHPHKIHPGRNWWRLPAVKCTFSPRCNRCIAIRQSCKKHTVRVTDADVGNLRRVLELTSCEKAESSSSCFVLDSEASCPTFGDVRRENISLSLKTHGV